MVNFNKWKLDFSKADFTWGIQGETFSIAEITKKLQEEINFWAITAVGEVDIFRFGRLEIYVELATDAATRTFGLRFGAIAMSGIFDMEMIRQPIHRKECRVITFGLNTWIASVPIDTHVQRKLKGQRVVVAVDIDVEIVTDHFA